MLHDLSISDAFDIHKTNSEFTQCELMRKRDNPATKLLSVEHDGSIAEYSGFGLVKKFQEHKKP